MIEVVEKNEAYDKWHTTKWYNHYSFSLIPVFQAKKADYYNTANFNFRWLFLQIWSLDSFAFELALNCDTHWGIGITAIIPYLRIRFTIPCPIKLDFLITRYLNRKPKCYKE